jgi:hypothetical protein
LQALATLAALTPSAAHFLRSFHAAASARLVSRRAALSRSFGLAVLSDYIVDANKRKIANIWGKAEQREAIADLIITLVNAHSEM